MNLMEMPSKEVILPAWWNCYEKNIEVIQWQLVRLNSSIFVLEKFFTFRFDLFAPVPYSGSFWFLAEQALFETCVMVIWRVVTDTNSEGLTLRQLKNDIFQNLSSHHKAEFAKLFQSTNFEEKISRGEPAIIELRGNYIAHLNRLKHTSPKFADIEERALLFSELKKIQEAINSFFKVLCFDCERPVLLFNYLHPPGNRPTDIEKLLDGVARDSGILNLPENDPHAWPLRREKLKKEDLELINKHRVKFGLPEA